MDEEDKSKLRRKIKEWLFELPSLAEFVDKLREELDEM